MNSCVFFVYSKHLLSFVTSPGVPESSRAQVSWVQDGGQLSLLAEMQAGAEHLKAEFTGGRTSPLSPRWEIYSRLQHEVRALLKRGISRSMQAKAHYQVSFIMIYLLEMSEESHVYLPLPFYVFLTSVR